MSRENTEKIERKRFQRKLNEAINWLYVLLDHRDDSELQLDTEEIKGLEQSIKFLKSLN